MKIDGEWSRVNPYFIYKPRVCYGTGTTPSLIKGSPPDRTGRVAVEEKSIY